MTLVPRGSRYIAALRWFGALLVAVLQLGIVGAVVYANVRAWRHPSVTDAVLSVGSLLFMPIGINLPGGRTIGWSGAA